MDERRDFVDRHLRAYLGQLSPGPGRETVRHKTQMTRDFLAHLEAVGVTDLRKVDPDDVCAYVGSLDYAPQTRSGLEFQLREVFDVLCGLGLAAVEGRALFPPSGPTSGTASCRTTPQARCATSCRRPTFPRRTA